MPEGVSSPRMGREEQPRVAPGVVLLVVPPFHGVTRPALGVSQLKANVEAQGVRAEVLYLNLLFAKRIGVRLYEEIFLQMRFLLGEQIFSKVLFERSDEDLDRYIAEVLSEIADGQELQYHFPDGQSTVGLRALLNRLLSDAGNFCQEDGIREILARDPWLVGLTSSFQQNCSSLCLCREIKKRRPEIVTILGGANCEEEMGEELFACFDELDFVGQGECDRSFVELVLALRSGESGAGIPGILARTTAPAETARPRHPAREVRPVEPTPGNLPVAVSCPPVCEGARPGSHRLLQRAELDALPHPDFSDYFSQLASSGLKEQIRPTLVMEASRGCWWGAKHQCTFCGLNGGVLAYRSKSSERVLEEMTALVERYGVVQMELVDNILDMKYFKTVLPHLAERPLAELTFETKANLTREQVRLMARANIRWIQPGVESLSDNTLKLMRKGVSALQNVQLLKWCMEEGIYPWWSHLFGFPGEREEEIDTIVHDMEALHHLRPPINARVLHLDRFSPYFNAPEACGLAPIYPIKAYRHVYPLPDESIRRIAYVFDSAALDGKTRSDAFAKLRGAIAAWRAAHCHSHLLVVPRGKGLILLDTRPRARRFMRRLTGLHARLYAYCDRIRNESAIAREFAGTATPERLQSVLQSFVADGLMLERDGRYLSLATALTAGYRVYSGVRSGGSVVGPALADQDRRRRRVRDAVALRIPARVVAGAALRRLRQAGAVSKSGIAVRLGRVLSQHAESSFRP